MIIHIVYSQWPLDGDLELFAFSRLEDAELALQELIDDWLDPSLSIEEDFNPAIRFDGGPAPDMQAFLFACGVRVGRWTLDVDANGYVPLERRKPAPAWDAKGEAEFRAVCRWAERELP